MTPRTNSERYEYVAVANFWDFLCLFRREMSGYYRVTSPDMPAMVAFGETMTAAREDAREALLSCLPGSAALEDWFADPRSEQTTPGATTKSPVLSPKFTDMKRSHPK